MVDVNRRALLTGGLALGGAAALGACDRLQVPGGGRVPETSAGASTATMTTPTDMPSTTGNEANDGSWRVTGPQPNQPIPTRLQRGDTPPQFVVVSWDGAGWTNQMPLLAHFRAVAAELKASMTLFLSGIYTVPKDQRTLYLPPGRAPGASAIPFFGPESVHGTIDNIGKSWLEGHEIGTHFNGHFCGSDGVATWTVDQWKDEIAQAKKFVMTWRTTTGFTDLDPFPFDYRTELVGGRTPCLDGSANLRIAADELGWRYDTSSTGNQVWPTKAGRLWALDMPSIPFVGHNSSVISMDYNMMVNQSRTPDGDPARRAQWQQEAADSWMAGFTRAYDGNRAPYIIGNHFENWNGGIYMAAVEQVMRKMATHPDTRFVSFRQLCDFLDAQDPTTLTRLRSLPIGVPPATGWPGFLTA
ncbi:hypothetical protein [Lapillicoccus sp.]|uniref:hypothetical protein n=1 Tax=Lapillicoccus sp. TaxID=1909287 RepID=UPI003266C946